MALLKIKIDDNFTKKIENVFFIEEYKSGSATASIKFYAQPEIILASI